MRPHFCGLSSSPVPVTCHLTLQWWYTEFWPWPWPSHSKVGIIRGCPYLMWELKASSSSVLCFLLFVFMYTHTYFTFLLKSHFKGCLRYVLQHLKICSAACFMNSRFHTQARNQLQWWPKVSNSLESLWEKAQRFGFHSQTTLCTTWYQANQPAVSYFMARWEPG